MAKRSRRSKQLEMDDWVKKAEELKARLNAEGAEVHVKGPVAPPIGYKKQPSLAEMVRAMVKSEKLRQAAEEEGYETFEESDDFDVDDDYDPRSPWENEFDPPIKEVLKAGREAIQARKSASMQKEASASTPPPQPVSPAKPGA